MDGEDLSYAEVQELTCRVARGAAALGHRRRRQGGDPVGQRPDRVCLRVRHLARRLRCGARSTRATRRPRTASCSTLFDCAALIFQSAFAPLVEQIRADLPQAARVSSASTRRRRGRCRSEDWLAGAGRRPRRRAAAVDDLAMIAGTGGTTGRPKGVMLTGRNLETMTALTLMGYPFEGRPVYLALAPLTHAAGVLCFPVLALGGEIVIMPHARPRRLPGADRAAPRHAHVPAADADLHAARRTRRSTRTDLSSLQCFWYGAAPMSAARLEEALTRIGPVMAQLFGQTEAPMMISMHAAGATTSMPTASVAPRAAAPRRAGRRRWCRSRSWTTDGELLPTGRARRDRRPRLAGDGRLLQEPGGHRRGVGRTAGTTPATSATSTRTASSTSSTAPRT